jgi:hypothetical protein
LRAKFKSLQRIWTDVWNWEPFQNCLLFLYTLFPVAV